MSGTHGEIEKGKRLLVWEAAKAAVIIVVLFAFILLVGRIGSLHAREEGKIVREAVFKAALTCYAVEGAYPDSLEHLKENYDLRYNEQQYLVTYDSFASNMLPDIYVTQRGARGN